MQARLQKWGGISSDVLYPPPPVRAYRCDAYGDYLFAVSRLAPLKRFDLLLRALAEPVAAGIRCVIAGEGAEMRSLLTLRAQPGLADRVEFTGRLSDTEVIGHLARMEKGAGGEVQLTDGMAKLIASQPFHGLRYEGRRFDCGDKAGFLEAQIAFALKREDLAPAMREILRRYA